MTEIIKTANMLTEHSVSILTQTPMGDGKYSNHRTSYVNSESGRNSLMENETEEIVAEVLAVWGDAPTIEEPDFTEVPEQKENSASSVWDEMATAIKEGVNEV